MKSEDVKSLIWTLLLIGFIRAFIVEPFKIPSGSMIPTLLVGDQLFVGKSSYDIGIPFTNIKLFKVADPKRGDVVVFEYPNNEHSPDKEGIYYIKRIIGLPGDRIVVHGGYPEVNGSKPQLTGVPDGPTTQETPGFRVSSAAEIFREILPGMDHAHWVQRYSAVIKTLPQATDSFKTETGHDCAEVASLIRPDAPYQSLGRLVAMNEVCPFTVPEGKYLMMGDNRDDSADGREWGFTLREQLKGRALFIWLSLNSDQGGATDASGSFLRWSRLGLKIN